MSPTLPIVLDAMGGDTAPRDPVRGAVAAASEDSLEVLLVGDVARIEAELAELEVEPEVRRRLELVQADEVVGMDEPAITPIRKKRRSSLRICAELVREGRSQAMVSAGNTGATMISAKMVIGVAPGVDRPALAATLPNHDGWTILLDVGANVDTRPEQLRQFAVMGHLYAREIVGVERPRVGLLSIGEEAGKGNEFTREVYGWLEESSLHFIGNIEGGDIFEGTADVVVCDGFVGNVVLKSAEGLATMIQAMLREEIVKSPLTRLGGGLIKPALLRFKQRTAYEEYGGAPLLGLKAGCFIAHGRSTPKAIHNALRRARTFVEHRVHERISQKMADLHITAEEAPARAREEEAAT
ncbi:MAG TPA: phosphate acyltransferase PlsX [Thermoanaerobaculia bacterium]|nr:phosphate acyltransferase PlsX [Thermoanaerobaculia bacterium]